MEGPHPLLLYPVLKRILSKLNFSELKSVREVCSEWKYEADLRLKNKGVVNIFHQEQLRKFVREIPFSHGIKLSTYYHLEGINLDTKESFKFFQLFGASIETLKLKFCEWKSSSLRSFLFNQLTNLVSLEMSIERNSGEWLDPLMPMSCTSHSHFNLLKKLRELKITGDYSHRTDLFYDLLKSSPNLEILHLSKHQMDSDDLFGTWLFEIILSCHFPNLTSLEVECTLIQQQIDSLVNKEYKLSRLSLDLETDAVMGNNSVDRILRHFPFLESVEFGFETLDNRIQRSLIQSIILKFKDLKGWIAIHTKNGAKIVFPEHAYVLES